MEKNLKKSKLYKIWDQVPPDYYQAGVSKNILQRIWHNHKVTNVKKLLSKIPYKNCLDVGCASGYMLSLLIPINPQATYIGVDSYDKAITYARKKYPSIKFYLASADKLPLKRSSLDLVLSYETIEHLENPLAFLKETRRVLKPDGTFILAMDSGSLLFKVVWWSWEKTFGQVWQGAHLNAFHHSDLEKIAKKAGFRVVRKCFTHLGLEVVLILKKAAV